jgi:hypothetical protein
MLKTRLMIDVLLASYRRGDFEQNVLFRVFIAAVVTEILILVKC